LRERSRRTDRPIARTLVCSTSDSFERLAGARNRLQTAGRSPAQLPVKRSGDVDWEWYAVDHVIQDRDPPAANYGVLSDHPELVDIDAGYYADWMHVNVLRPCRRIRSGRRLYTSTTRC
jgi:hypothetical protein